MEGNPKTATAALLLLAFLPLAAAAQKKEIPAYNLGPGGSVVVSNSFGRVTVRPAPGRELQISAHSRSDAVEVDHSQSGNRVIIRTHYLDRNRPEADRTVDYELLVPADVSVTIKAGSGAVQIEGVSGDISVESEKASVEVRNLGSGHLNIRNMAGPTTVTNVGNAHVEITSVSGGVQLQAVSGPKVKVNSTSGSIRYDGSFGAGGDYTLINHSGDIEVALASGASVDMTAHSVRGKVENDFPFQQKQHVVPAPNQFTGVSHSGSSTVQLQSFSGRIRVKKK